MVSFLRLTFLFWQMALGIVPALGELPLTASERDQLRLEQKGHYWEDVERKDQLTTLLGSGRGKESFHMETRRTLSGLLTSPALKF